MAGVNIKEIALHFGEGQRLTGVLSLPPQGSTARVAVVLPSTGLDPRPGPNRLHVHIARALAAAGHPVLRMDIGGLGDSDMPPGRSTDALDDLRDALDMLVTRRYGPHFALVGDCSGAHDAHRLALADTRVSAAVFVDGYAYETPKHISNRRWARLQRAPRKLSELFKHRGKGPETPAGGVGYFHPPPQAEAAAGYQTLRQRGVRLAFAYTGDVENEYSYAEQCFDAFPALRGAASVWHLREADHTFTRRVAREQFIALLGDWLAAG